MRVRKRAGSAQKRGGKGESARFGARGAEEAHLLLSISASNLARHAINVSSVTGVTPTTPFKIPACATPYRQHAMPVLLPSQNDAEIATLVPHTAHLSVPHTR
eukprot:3576626-Rhodomonas_salina.1